MWYDNLHWPIAALLVGVALYYLRRHEAARAAMFAGMAIAVLGRVHIGFLIVGVLVASISCLKIQTD